MEQEGRDLQAHWEKDIEAAKEETERIRAEMEVLKAKHIEEKQDIQFSAACSGAQVVAQMEQEGRDLQAHWEKDIEAAKEETERIRAEMEVLKAKHIEEKQDIQFSAACSGAQVVAQ